MKLPPSLTSASPSRSPSAVKARTRRPPPPMAGPAVKVPEIDLVSAVGVSVVGFLGFLAVGVSAVGVSEKRLFASTVLTLKAFVALVLIDSVSIVALSGFVVPESFSRMYPSFVDVALVRSTSFGGNSPPSFFLSDFCSSLLFVASIPVRSLLDASLSLSFWNSVSDPVSSLFSASTEFDSRESFLLANILLLSFFFY